jgi:hypothetical protein
VQTQTHYATISAQYYKILPKQQLKTHSFLILEREWVCSLCFWVNSGIYFIQSGHALFSSSSCMWCHAAQCLTTGLYPPHSSGIKACLRTFTQALFAVRSLEWQTCFKFCSEFAGVCCLKAKFGNVLIIFLGYSFGVGKGTGLVYLSYVVLAKFWKKFNIYTYISA